MGEQPEEFGARTYFHPHDNNMETPCMERHVIVFSISSILDPPLSPTDESVPYIMPSKTLARIWTLDVPLAASSMGSAVGVKEKEKTENRVNFVIGDENPVKLRICYSLYHDNSGNL